MARRGGITLPACQPESLTFAPRPPSYQSRSASLLIQILLSLSCLVRLSFRDYDGMNTSTMLFCAVPALSNLYVNLRFQREFPSWPSPRTIGSKQTEAPFSPAPRRSESPLLYCFTCSFQSTVQHTLALSTIHTARIHLLAMASTSGIRWGRALLGICKNAHICAYMYIIIHVYRTIRGI